MRKVLLLFFSLLSGMMLYAQMPDWVLSKPVSHNYTMDYEVGIGEGDTYKQAQNEAYIDVLKKLISRCRLAISTKAVVKAVYEGKPLTTIDKNLVLPPIREVCSSAFKQSDGSIRVYLLYQVPRDGSVIFPQYEDFSDCYTFDMTLRQSNTRAIVASSFIPGMGQMLKGQGGAGAAFLVSEVALFGGGTACYFFGQEQSRIMKTTASSYQDFSEAKNKKRTWDIATYCCFGVGAAVHIANMVQAYYAKDMRLHTDMAFVPALIPINEYSQPRYAMGTGVQIKF